MADRAAPEIAGGAGADCGVDVGEGACYSLAEDVAACLRVLPPVASYAEARVVFVTGAVGVGADGTRAVLLAGHEIRIVYPAGVAAACRACRQIDSSWAVCKATTAQCRTVASLPYLARDASACLLVG